MHHEHSTRTRTAALAMTLALGTGLGPVLASPQAQAAPAPTTTRASSPAKADATSTRSQQALRKARSAAVKAGVEKKVRAFLSEHDVPLPERPLLAADGEACQRETEVTRYVEGQAAGMTLLDQVFLTVTAADMLPLLEAVQAQDPRANNVDVTGKGNQLRTSFAGLQHFWDIDGSSIQLKGMTGQMLADPGRVQAVYEGLGIPAGLASVLGQAVATYTQLSPGLDHGRNPLLTFNAVAIPGSSEAGTGDRIVMGEGMLRAYDALGHGEIAPQVVLAHEYGHQVQFATGMITPEDQQAPTAQKTRYTELHADASAAYFVAHPRGGKESKAALSEVDDVLLGIGDCQVDSAGHHGTPAQRGRAGTWGMAQAAAKPSKVMPAADFRAAYDKALPTLLGSAKKPQLDRR